MASVGFPLDDTTWFIMKKYLESSCQYTPLHKDCLIRNGTPVVWMIKNPLVSISCTVYKIPEDMILEKEDFIKMEDNHYVFKDGSNRFIYINKENVKFID